MIGALFCLAVVAAELRAIHLVHRHAAAMIEEDRATDEFLTELHRIRTDIAGQS